MGGASPGQSAEPRISFAPSFGSFDNFLYVARRFRDASLGFFRSHRTWRCDGRIVLRRRVQRRRRDGRSSGRNRRLEWNRSHGRHRWPGGKGGSAPTGGSAGSGTTGGSGGTGAGPSCVAPVTMCTAPCTPATCTTVTPPQALLTDFSNLDNGQLFGAKDENGVYKRAGTCRVTSSAGSSRTRSLRTCAPPT